MLPSLRSKGVEAPAPSPHSLCAEAPVFVHCRGCTPIQSTVSQHTHQAYWGIHQFTQTGIPAKHTPQQDWQKGGSGRRFQSCRNTSVVAFPCPFTPSPWGRTIFTPAIPVDGTVYDAAYLCTHTGAGSPWFAPKGPGRSGISRELMHPQYGRARRRWRCPFGVVETMQTDCPFSLLRCAGHARVTVLWVPDPFWHTHSQRPRTSSYSWSAQHPGCWERVTSDQIR